MCIRKYHSITIFLFFTSIAVSPLRAQVPSINPTRPSLTNSPGLNPVHALEFETGISSLMSSSDPTMWSLPVTLRYTISQHWEVRLMTDGLLLPFGGATSVTFTRSAAYWVQYDLTPDADENAIHWALGGGSYCPDLSASIPFGEWSHSAMVSLQRSVLNFTVVSNIIAGVTSADGSTTITPAATLQCSRSVAEGVTPFIDGMYTFASGGNEADWKAMLGVGYAVNPGLILDAAWMVGKGDVMQLTAGISLQIN